MDESATGSVNFFGPVSLLPETTATISPAMHLRPPAIDHGIISLLWAVFFGLFIWIGGSAVGYSSSETFIIGAVVGFLTFVFVRVYGDEEPRRP